MTDYEKGYADGFRARRAFIGKRSPTLQEVEDVILEHFGMTRQALHKRSRYRRLVYARHIFYYLVMHFTKYGCLEAAKYFGQNHSTVLHGRDTLQDDIDTNEDIYWEVETIKTKLLNKLECKSYKSSEGLVRTLPSTPSTGRRLPIFRWQ